MSHIRQQIREQAVLELQAIVPFNNQVFSTRLMKFRMEDLPACNVYAESEEDEAITIAGQGARLLQRELVLAVEIYDVQKEDIDNQLDDLAVEVEKLLGNSTLNNLAFDVQLASTSFSFDTDAETPTGILTLFWSVQYHTTEGDPETAK